MMDETVLLPVYSGTTYCVHVNSRRMWITSETELKQQSDADLLFLYTVSKNDPCTCELGLTDRISGASEPTSE